MTHHVPIPRLSFVRPPIRWGFTLSLGFLAMAVACSGDHRQENVSPKPEVVNESDYNAQTVANAESARVVVAQAIGELERVPSLRTADLIECTTPSDVLNVLAKRPSMTRLSSGAAANPYAPGTPSFSFSQGVDIPASKPGSVVISGVVSDSDTGLQVVRIRYGTQNDGVPKLDNQTSPLVLSDFEMLRNLATQALAERLRQNVVQGLAELNLRATDRSLDLVAAKVPLDVVTALAGRPVFNDLSAGAPPNPFNLGLPCYSFSGSQDVLPERPGCVVMSLTLDPVTGHHFVHLRFGTLIKGVPVLNNQIEPLDVDNREMAANQETREKAERIRAMLSEGLLVLDSDTLGSTDIQSRSFEGVVKAVSMRPMVNDLSKGAPANSYDPDTVCYQFVSQDPGAASAPGVVTVAGPVVDPSTGNPVVYIYYGTSINGMPSLNKQIQPLIWDQNAYEEICWDQVKANAEYIQAEIVAALDELDLPQDRRSYDLVSANTVDAVLAIISSRHDFTNDSRRNPYDPAAHAYCFGSLSGQTVGQVAVSPLVIDPATGKAVIKLGGSRLTHGIPDYSIRFGSIPADLHEAARNQRTKANAEWVRNFLVEALGELNLPLAERSMDIQMLGGSPSINDLLNIIALRDSFNPMNAASLKNPFGPELRAFAFHELDVSEPGVVFISDPMMVPETGKPAICLGYGIQCKGVPELVKIEPIDASGFEESWNAATRINASRIKEVIAGAFAELDLPLEQRSLDMRSLGPDPRPEEILVILSSRYQPSDPRTPRNPFNSVQSAYTWGTMSPNWPGDVAISGSMIDVQTGLPVIRIHYGLQIKGVPVLQYELEPLPVDQSEGARGLATRDLAQRLRAIVAKGIGELKLPIENRSLDIACLGPDPTPSQVLQVLSQRMSLSQIRLGAPSNPYNAAEACWYFFAPVVYPGQVSVSLPCMDPETGHEVVYITYGIRALGCPILDKRVEALDLTQ